MMPTPPAPSRPRGRPPRLRRWRRVATALAAASLVTGVAAACEPDVDPPSWSEVVLRQFVVTPLGPHATVSWPAADGGPTRYRIDVDGTTIPVPAGTATSCVLVGLAPSTTYDVTISAYDAAGNWSGDLGGPRTRLGSVELTHTTGAGPTGGPSRRCVPTTDADLDRLPDALETGDGAYAHPAATGSSPTLKDSDSDGIGDGDEVLGTTQGLDLHALGARPEQRDLIVEMDWLTGFTPARACTTWPNLQPTAARVQEAVDTYAEVPLSSPLGGQGINLIVDRGQGGPFTGGGPVPDDDGRLDMRQAQAAHMAPERVGFVHYALNVIDFYVLLAGYRTGGLAPKPGSVLTIGYGCGSGPSDWSLSAILAHELGHNLDLNHGGHDAVNGKPNYDSIMNYSFAYGLDLDCDGQSNTDPATRRLGFSTVVRPSIDESAVREVNGACGNVPVDFDFDGTIDQAPYARDLSGNGTLEVLHGSNDLQHMSLARSFPQNRSGGPEGADVFDPLLP